jgi:hypothetical protein
MAGSGETYFYNFNNIKRVWKDFTSFSIDIYILTIYT